MRARPGPIDLEVCDEPWVESLEACNPDSFESGGGRIGVPLVVRDEVLGLITLADRVNGMSFSSEDMDLLKCIGDQVAASLLNLRFSQQLVRAKELEAFQAMSAFFVHDLKNTAHTLSLLLQNLASHFQDAAFREDAVRAVSNSVRHLDDLISRLGLLRQKLEIRPVEADLNKVVATVLERVPLPDRGALRTDLQPLPSFMLDPEQVQKVVTNLLLNARDATCGRGCITISTARENDWAILAVEDEGCGMSAEFMSRSLFRPLQTTKKTGIGIGMYHTKMIVEAHRGRIEVQSELGKGTTIRALLPLKRKPS
jgi:putative PEP-CTERM system histidine kinase